MKRGACCILYHFNKDNSANVYELVKSKSFQLKLDGSILIMFMLNIILSFLLSSLYLENIKGSYIEGSCWKRMSYF